LPVVVVSVFSGHEALAGEWVVAKPIDADELIEALGAAMLEGRVRVLVVGRSQTRDLLAPRPHELAIEHEWATSSGAAADLRETFKAERRRSQELRASYMATVRALANAVEARDAYTGHHAERVAAYGLELAHAAGLALADDPQTEFGFLLHDVGKVAVPDAILFKPAPLTDEERVLMEQHPMIGWEILREIDFLGDA